jgi:uncharacterized protein YjiS (DUF1127 family)
MENTTFRKTAPALPAAAEVSRDFAAVLFRAPAAALGWLAERQHQAEERAHLSRLTDHQLQDMGLTRPAAEAMARKTGWSRPV